VGLLGRVRDHGLRARQHARLLQAEALALSARSTYGPLAAYLALSFAYFGLPVASHFGDDWVGKGTDPQIFVWSLAWWPHAILHWQNPVVTHAVWPPVGLDLTWASSVPALAAAFAPLTLTAGPVASYNAAMILAPALAAWTAYLLCRHVTRSSWPSLAGGYLFGFSSYELGHLLGHMNLSWVFLVPLATLVILRYVEGSLDARGLVFRLGPLLALQFLLSTELLFTLTLALLVSWITAAVLVPASRGRLVHLWRPLLAAYSVAALLTSPLLVYALAHFQRGSLNPPGDYSADLLNVVIPTRLAAFDPHLARRITAPFIGNLAENGAYLGLPLLVIICWFAWQRRRRPTARLLVALLLLAVVAELGPYLRVRGASYAPLPWKPLVHLPLLNNVLPARFALFAVLVAALIASTWAAGTAPLVVRAALVGAAVAVTLPALGNGFWHGKPRRPGFFADALYRRCLPPQATVFSLPYPTVNSAMLWQAEAGFRFRVADAYLTPVVPHGVPGRAVLETLLDGLVPAGGGRAIVRVARAQGADGILLDREHAQPWRSLLRQTGLHARTVGGIDLYDLRGTLASCPSSSGRRGASSTSSRSTSAPGASSASRSPSSCSSGETARSSCSTASRTPRAT
jgi:hypothetical protein